MSADLQVGRELPAELKCGWCRKRITRTAPRAFVNEKYACGDCLYYLERGENPPTANE